jgi:hypothetical protein
LTIDKEEKEVRRDMTKQLSAARECRGGGDYEESLLAIDFFA